MTKNEKVDYDAIIRENARIVYESERQYRQMLADHERQIAVIVVQAQMETMRAFQKGVKGALRPKARRVTVAI